MLAEAGNHAVVSVELGVQAARVVRYGDVRRVRQAHRLHALNAQIKQHQIFQFLPGGDGVAHRHHVAYAVLLDVSGRHGKVLRRQQCRHRGQAQHTAHIRLTCRLCAGLLQRVKAAFNLCHGAAELDVGGNQLLRAVCQCQGALGNLSGNLRHRVLIVHKIVQLPIDLVQLLLQLRNAFLHMVPIRAVSPQQQRYLGNFRLQLHILGLGLDGGNLLGLLGRGQGGIILHLLNPSVILRLLLLQACHPVCQLQQGIQLLAGVLLLLLQLLQCLPHRFQRLHHRPGYRLLLRAFHGLLGTFQLRLCGTELSGGLIQLPVHRLRQAPGKGVQLFLTQYHMHLPLHRAADRHTGHACNALQLWRQRVLHKVRKVIHILALIADGHHIHRQHGGVHFQHIGCAHGVAP